MRTRPLGKTSLTVTELALGTWGLSGDAYGPVQDFEQDRVIDRALALGVGLFDTADAYANGAMEKKLGERLPQGSHVKVVTRLGTDRSAEPVRKRFDRAYLSAAFERSRERLKGHTEIVLLHNPVLATVELGEATEVLAELKRSGAIAAWGVSAGSAEVARAAIAKGAEVLSMQYHALFSSDLRDLHDDISTHGVGLLAHSVLGHGLLAGYWSLHKQFPRGDHRADRWTPDELRRRVLQLPSLRALVSGEVLTMRSVALRFGLSNDDVSSVVLGPRNIVQLDQLVREAGKGPPYLTKEQLDKLAFSLDYAGSR